MPSTSSQKGPSFPPPHHLPFFPLNSPPAGIPPKIPSGPRRPFFPFYSPPPSSPSGASQPTFPVNITSLVVPDAAASPPPRRAPAVVVPAVLVPLLALAVLVAALFLRRRRLRRRGRLSDNIDGAALSYTATASSSPGPDVDAGPYKPAVPGHEFLYVGTLVSSHQGGDFTAMGTGLGYGKLDSPELRPLPPLTSQFPRAGLDRGGGSSEEEFYSPALSSGDRKSPRGSETAEVSENGGSQSRSLSTPSYPSSPSPCLGFSPRPSSCSKSLECRSVRNSDFGVGFVPELLPFDDKDEILSGNSKSLASTEGISVDGEDHSVGILERNEKFSGGAEDSANMPLVLPPEDKLGNKSSESNQTSDYLASAREFSHKPTVISQHIGLPIPPPPPPPPLGNWERRFTKPQSVQPMFLANKGTSKAQNSTTLAFPTDSLHDSDGVERFEEARPKLKPLHWDKVRASSDRAMVWDQLKTSSFQVDEEMIETLFVAKAKNATNTDTNKHNVVLQPSQESRILDPKRSQNIAILLRALNVTKEEVCEALLEGNADALGTELLETLLKMTPSKEEELKLKEHNDESSFKLDPAEKFLKALIDIPFAFKRMDAMIYIANFNSEIDYLKKSFDTLEAACGELRDSRLFLKLLEAVLKTGNRMNVGTNRGDAHAFKLDTLLKLVDVKGTDGKTTLLHFVVQEIIRAEGNRTTATSSLTVKEPADDLAGVLECKKRGLQVVAALGNELSNVKKAAAIDSDVLNSYVSKLASGINKIRGVLILTESTGSRFNGFRFCNAMNSFLKDAEDEIIKVQSHESEALLMVREITEYFHGNSAQEEAHPFRIFTVVRDFLVILDQVCEEVGKMHRRIGVNPTLPLVFPTYRLLQTAEPTSSDEDTSLWS